MRKLFLTVIILSLCLIPLCACSNVQAYSADEDDSYHIKTFHSGGDENTTSCEITKVCTMNMLGSERIILQIKTPDDSKEKLPYYELKFTDEEKEDFTFTVYSTTLKTTELVGKEDFDLIDSIEFTSADGNVTLHAECDESLKFKIDENKDSMQLVICVKELHIQQEK